MAPLKAPRLDGMPPLFYQHFWGTVKQDVTTSILTWLNSDDSLLFCRAIIKECGKVLEILNLYEEALGQKVNRSKTTLLFSKCTPIEAKHAIKVALGVLEIMQYESYLGLPSFVGRGKKASFNYIKEKIWRKLQGWELKLLS
ncbi:uncharacterized protein LOC112030800 [Quercus suber]|uniref:uncharacterized protein LOC112030800 n=1 Tax=Quercus suber TaxID=58331 RepID=UPI000CE1F098|nr:uncharacterized protein LOC112030800 [Quercus suber]